MMPKRTIATFAVVAAISIASSAAWSEPKDIRWGTGPVGSSGHKALVVLANLLNKEMPEYRISVLPLPGAVMTVKGYATGEYDGYYGSDIALAGTGHRFRSLQGLQVAHEAPAGAVVLVLHAGCRPRDQGQQYATRSRSGPISPARRSTPGRCRSIPASSSSARMAAVGVKHIYTQVDLSTAGSQLESGAIDAHDHLHGRRHAAGAVDLAGLACGRLGGAQSERRRDRDARRRRVSRSSR